MGIIPFETPPNEVASPEDGAFNVRLIDAQRGRGVVAVQAIPAEAGLYMSRADLAVLYSPFAGNHCAVCFAACSSCNEAEQQEGEDINQDAAQSQGHACPTCDQFVLCRRCVEVLEDEVRSGQVVSLKLGESSPSDGDHSPLLLRHPILSVHRVSCMWYASLPSSVRAPGLDTDYLRFCLEYGAHVVLGSRACAENINALCDNEGIQSAEAISFCEGFARQVVNTFATASPHPYPVSMEELRGVLLRVRSNSVGFPFTSTATIGWSLEKVTCMLNHSCVPNAAVVSAEHNASFHQFSLKSRLGSLGIKALRPIALGEELTLSYVDVEAMDDVTERSRHILTTYRFLCKCEKCESQRAEKKNGVS